MPRPGTHAPAGTSPARDTGSSVVARTRDHRLLTFWRRAKGWIANPWGRPRVLAVVAWTYVVWSIVPVLVAIQFSFNKSGSLTVWQGFSTQWYWGNDYSVWGDPGLQSALLQSLRLASLDVAIAVPLGVLLALGLSRWRGRGSGFFHLVALMPLAAPQLVLGVALFLVFTQLATFIHTGTIAQLLGHVTFTLPYVVVIVGGRLALIGREYEEAAADLGAAPLQSVRFVLLPLLLPALIASLTVTFALSIDNFVISYYLSCGGGCDTVPVVIYNSARGGPGPSTNAIASVTAGITLITLTIGFLLYRLTSHGRSLRSNPAANS